MKIKKGELEEEEGSFYMKRLSLFTLDLPLLSFG